MTTTQIQPPAPKRSWRRVPRGRTAIATGAVVASLAIGGAGFGAGYAVGDHATPASTTTQQPGFPADGGMRGPGGDMSGQMGGPMGTPPGGQPGGQSGTAPDGTQGTQPDFDGDGVPDTDSDSGTDSGSDTSAS